MTANEAITVALAERCGFDTDSTFSEREILYIAWERFPRKFCIGSNPEHPDLKKVSVLLASKFWTSIRGRGWLERASRGRYRLTQAGVDVAMGLSAKVASC